MSEEQPGRDVRRRLHTALSSSALAGLVLVGDFVRQADARAESTAAVKKHKPGRPQPSRRSGVLPMIPWLISFVSVVALIVVIVVSY